MSGSQPPGPTGVWKVPNTVQTEIDRHEFHRRLLSKYGDVCRYTTTRGETYLLSGVENQTRVLVEDDDQFVKPEVRENHPVFRTGVVGVDGEAWQSQRNRIGQVVRERAVTSRLPELTATFREVVSEWSEPSAVKVENGISEAMIRVFAGLLFGDTDSLDIDRVERALVGLLGEPAFWRGLVDSLFPWAPGDILADWRLRRGRRYEELDEELRSAFEAHERGGSPPDLASLLAAATSSDGLTTDNVRDELITFLMTGFGNPTRTLTRVLAHLGDHSELRHRLREEVCEHTDGRLNHDSIDQMTACENYLSEFLRLYPPAPNVSRVVTNDIEVDGYLIPADSSVVVATWHVQRDGQYWDRPGEFNPRRWRGGRGRPKYYAPFGAGLRACPARDLFYALAKIFLKVILRRFEFSTEDSCELHPGVNLGESAGVTVKFRER